LVVIVTVFSLQREAWVSRRHPVYIHSGRHRPLLISSICVILPGRDVAQSG